MSREIEFAKSLSGHDKNQIYLVKEKDEKFVYLVNGTTKPLDAPMQKSRKHIQVIRRLPQEVLDVLDGTWSDTAVKRAVKLYQCRNQEDL